MKRVFVDTGGFVALLVAVHDVKAKVAAFLTWLPEAENLQLDSPEFSRQHPQPGMHLMMLRRMVDEEFLVNKGETGAKDVASS